MSHVKAPLKHKIGENEFSASRRCGGGTLEGLSRAKIGKVLQEKGGKKRNRQEGNITRRNRKVRESDHAQRKGKKVWMRVNDRKRGLLRGGGRRKKPWSSFFLRIFLWQKAQDRKRPRRGTESLQQGETT